LSLLAPIGSLAQDRVERIVELIVVRAMGVRPPGRPGIWDRHQSIRKDPQRRCSREIAYASKQLALGDRTALHEHEAPGGTHGRIAGPDMRSEMLHDLPVADEQNIVAHRQRSVEPGEEDPHPFVSTTFIGEVGREWRASRRPVLAGNQGFDQFAVRDPAGAPAQDRGRRR
jgi:hypothetical protein